MSATIWNLLPLLLLVGCSDPAATSGSASPTPVNMTTNDRPPAVRAINWKVDLARYAGKWYEIAYYPTRFAKGCTATTAEYKLRSDGKLECVNRCNDKKPSGKARKTEGVGKVVDTGTNAKLKFTYYLIFKGDYWIVDLDPEYQWCVVSDPKRDTLFIRSRKPTLDPKIYAGILTRLEQQGFDIGKIERTVWPE